MAVAQGPPPWALAEEMSALATDLGSLSLPQQLAVVAIVLKTRVAAKATPSEAKAELERRTSLSSPLFIVGLVFGLKTCGHTSDAIFEALSGSAAMAAADACVALLEACLFDASQAELERLGLLAASFLDGACRDAANAAVVHREEHEMGEVRQHARFHCTLAARVLEQLDAKDRTGSAAASNVRKALHDAICAILSLPEQRSGATRTAELRQLVLAVMEPLYNAPAMDAGLEAIWAPLVALAASDETLETALSAICLVFEHFLSAKLSTPLPLRASLWQVIFRALQRADGLCRRRGTFLLQRVLAWAKSREGNAVLPAAGARTGGTDRASVDERLALWEKYIQVLDVLDTENHNNLIEQVWPTLAEFCARVDSHGTDCRWQKCDGNNNNSATSTTLLCQLPSPLNFGWVSLLLSGAFALRAQGLRRRALDGFLYGELRIARVEHVDEEWVAGTLLPAADDMVSSCKATAARDTLKCAVSAWLRFHLSKLPRERQLLLVRAIAAALPCVRSPSALTAVVNGLWLENSRPCYLEKVIEEGRQPDNAAAPSAACGTNVPLLGAQEVECLLSPLRVRRSDSKLWRQQDLLDAVANVLCALMDHEDPDMRLDRGNWDRFRTILAMFPLKLVATRYASALGTCARRLGLDTAVAQAFVGAFVSDDSCDAESVAKLVWCLMSSYFADEGSRELLKTRKEASMREELLKATAPAVHILSVCHSRPYVPREKVARALELFSCWAVSVEAALRTGNGTVDLLAPLGCCASEVALYVDGAVRSAMTSGGQATDLSAEHVKAALTAVLTCLRHANAQDGLTSAVAPGLRSLSSACGSHLRIVSSREAAPSQLAAITALECLLCIGEASVLGIDAAEAAGLAQDVIAARWRGSGRSASAFFASQWNCLARLLETAAGSSSKRAKQAATAINLAALAALDDSCPDDALLALLRCLRVAFPTAVLAASTSEEREDLVRDASKRVRAALERGLTVPASLADAAAAVFLQNQLFDVPELAGDASWLLREEAAWQQEGQIWQMPPPPRPPLPAAAAAEPEGSSEGEREEEEEESSSLPPLIAVVRMLLRIGKRGRPHVTTQLASRCMALWTQQPRHAALFAREIEELLLYHAPMVEANDMLKVEIDDAERDSSAAANTDVGQRQAGLNGGIAASTSARGYVRFVLLDFLEKVLIPAAAGGDEGAKALLWRLSRRLLTLYSVPGWDIVTVWSEATFLTKLRAWQALCVLTRFLCDAACVPRDSAPLRRFCECFWEGIRSIALPPVRQCMEIVGIRLCQAAPSMAIPGLLRELGELNPQGQVLCSLLIIAGHLAMAPSPDATTNGNGSAASLSSGGLRRQEDRAALLAGVLPWTASAHGHARVMSQLVAHHLLPEFLPLANLKDLNDNDDNFGGLANGDSSATAMENGRRLKGGSSSTAAAAAGHSIDVKVPNRGLWSAAAAASTGSNGSSYDAAAAGRTTSGDGSEAKDVKAALGCAVLQRLWRILCENTDMTKMRAKQGHAFRSTDIAAHCSVTGLLGLYGVDNHSGELLNCHMTIPLHESMVELSEEIRKETELPPWKEVDVAIKSGEWFHEGAVDYAQKAAARASSAPSNGASSSDSTRNTPNKSSANGNDETVAETANKTTKAAEPLFLQRKITPWDELDLLVREDADAKRRNAAGRLRRPLVVCASLIDKATNLGGLARTCEVFAASKLVVHSRKVLLERDFKTLSVGAQDWLPVEEVPPPQLPAFLRRMRRAGYAVVGVEQTNGSRCLTQAKLPSRAVLLLGHERSGIPVELLGQVDFCVEIPQMGVIRSLNVHVTGALMVWEHARQHFNATFE